MPYPSSKASRGIVVETVGLSLDIDKRWAKVGDKVKFSGKLTKNGLGYGGEYVDIYILKGLSKSRVGYSITGSDGSFVDEWTIPSWLYIGYEEFDLACQDWKFQAEHSPSETVSNTKNLAVAYPTRISIKAPDKAFPGESITISGKLEYRLNDVWVGLSGKTVKIYLDSTLLGSPTTDSDGSYQLKVSISKSGTLKAVFEGEKLPTAIFSYAPSEAYLLPQAQALDIITILGASIPILVPLSAIISNELAKRR